MIYLESNVMLLIILALAVLGKANSVAVGTCILLIANLLNIQKYIFPSIEKNGVSWGLILLIASILIPIANGSITYIHIKSTFISWIGITALLLSFFTTYLSGLGLKYLKLQGHGDIMPAMILGAVVSAALLGGVPVGPLITSGILALITRLADKK